MEKFTTKHGWKLGEAKTIITTPIFKLKEKTAICLRSNAQSQFYTLEYPNWVTVIAITPDDKIVLIKQFRHGTEHIEIETPAGLIDEGETPLEAAPRELLEETGYTGDAPISIGSVCPNPALQFNVCHTILIKNAKKTNTINLEATEDIETFTLSLSELEDYIKTSKITNGLVLNALFFYKLYC
jgi:8-oxo-dGTP pyrophosphatase MutT (NUDIX family)